MNFRTVVPIDKKPFNLLTNCVLIGSCFTEHIGRKLQLAGFNTLVNPTGIIYNPISISKTIGLILDPENIHERDLLNNNGVWFHWDFHGHFSNIDSASASTSMNKSLQNGHTFIERNHTLIITFGSSWVYTLKDSHHLVANCHKMPGNIFDKRLLTVDEIVSNYRLLISKLQDHQTTNKVIFTVSPVRHIRDGFIENQHSKSILIIAIQQLMREFPEFVDYFPAYEIMMDELRDYRFYDRDMLHPNTSAVDYIWHQFKESYFDDAMNSQTKDFNHFYAMFSHHSKYPGSVNDLKFKEKLEEYKNFLVEKYPEATLIPLNNHHSI